MRPATRFTVLAAATLAAACRNGGDPNVVVLSGRLEAPVVDLAPKVAGRVVEVKVREGDRVKAGDLIARLDLGETALAPERDARGLQSAEARFNDLRTGSRAAEIKGAEQEVADRRAAVELAKPELERQQILLSKKVGIPRDVDVARANLERAEASLKMSEERLVLAETQYLPGQVELQIVDVHDEPALVVHDGILAVPTLVKRLPEPLRKLVGDLSNTARVRVGLGLPPGRPDERLERQP